MAVSVVDIVNRALRMIGENPITNLTDGSNEANVASDLYSEARDELLRSHPWNFAIKRVKLARLTAEPTTEFNYKYQLPDDFIRVVEVAGNDENVPDAVYRIEGDTILADWEDLYLRYVAQITDPNMMPADFRTALSRQLAADMALPLVQSNTVEDQMTKRARAALLRAKSTDAITDYPQRRPWGSWITGRQRGNVVNPQSTS